MLCMTSARRSKTQAVDHLTLEKWFCPPPGEGLTNPSHKKSQKNSLAFGFLCETMSVVAEYMWTHIRLR